ncbi:hypothetical protein [Sphingobium phenoxybenzoativorans]|uniref:hypothetical protein n=1 Tax=Sphingobium phenoxybenzoativorans TaxID=1592790 RepID=UPI00087207DF|nr:hypothetical protein [Sphingobium phenoxybenzoativorans]
MKNLLETVYQLQFIVTAFDADHVGRETGSFSLAAMGSGDDFRLGCEYVGAYNPKHRGPGAVDGIELNICGGGPGFERWIECCVHMIQLKDFGYFLINAASKYCRKIWTIGQD